MSENARQDTYTRPADANCPRTYVGAPAETAATIIAKVGAACGISQQVLLVILQKEQGLVTLSGNNLTARRYERAIGYGCPDTASCNPAYAHLFNQLYSAASRYRYYASNPTKFNHRAGLVNQVRFHPNAACGSSAVLIENQATAGLYNHTPYQPNAAALAAGKGTGNGCSAYGNRNFWIYFTDWFGSTQVPGAGEVAARYAALGGGSGALGAITTSVACGLRNGGCWQGYARGAIYWSPVTGARVVWNGAVRDKWATYVWEAGPLGYPTGDGVCGLAGGGCYQPFEGGSLYWSPATGAHLVSGAVRDRWASLSYEFGALGYPLTDQATTPNGAAQYVHFQRRSIYWSRATGARVLSGPVYALWAAGGWETGVLGLPVSNVGTTPDRTAQYAHFQHGSIYSTPTGAHLLPSAVVTAWARTGWERGPLGYPVAATGSREQLPAGAVVQTFQGGAVYASPATGGRAVESALLAAYRTAGGAVGALGLPMSDTGTTPDGLARYQHFQGGSIYSTRATGVRVLPTVFRDAWARTGWELGPFGFPTTDVRTTPTDSDGSCTSRAGRSTGPGPPGRAS